MRREQREAVGSGAGERDAHLLRALAEMGRIVGSSPTPTEAFSGFADQLRQLIPFDRIAIFRFERQRERLVVLHAAGMSMDGLNEGSVLQVGGTPYETVAHRHAQVLDLVPREGAAAGLESALRVPLVAGEEVVGALELAARKPGAYGKAEAALLERAAAYVAGTVAGTRPNAATTRETEERAALARIAVAVGSDLDINRLYERVADEVGRLLPFDRLSITAKVPDEEAFEIAFVRGVRVEGREPGARTVPDPRGEWRTDGGYPRTIDTGVNDHSLRAPEIVNAGLKSRVEVPIGNPSQPDSYIALHSFRERAYAERDADFLERVAMHIAPAIRNARLYADARREARERAVLAEIGRIISFSLDISEVYERFAEQARLLIDFDRIAISLPGPEPGTLVNAYVSGEAGRERSRGDVLPMAGSVVGEVMRSGKSIVLEASDAKDLGARYPALRKSLRAGLRSLIAVPLVSRNEVIGVLRLRSKKVDAYGERDVRLAERVGSQIAGAIANSRLHAQAMQLAKEREMRTRLDAENRELTRIAQAKRRFLSTISHELKTPLTSLLAFTHILRRNRAGNLTSRQLEQLDVMERNGERLKVLINDLLDLSRIDADAFEIRQSRFDAADLVRDLAQSFKPVFTARGQELKVSLRDEPLVVEADRERIAQVISNLLTNASKFSPAGALVELTACGREDRLYVAVSDTGPGIADAERERVFTAFYRADNEQTRAVPGTGIGLYLAKSIVEMHDGEIELLSKPGKGATVRFYIKTLLPDASLNAGGSPASPAARSRGT